MTVWTRHRYWISHVLSSALLLGGTAALIVPKWVTPESGLMLAQPWFLLGWLLLPLVVLQGVRRPRLSGRLLFSAATVLGDVPPGWRVRLLPWRTGLRTVVLGLLILALARPQDANEPSYASLEGIDTVITLDLSGSMNALDMNPSRFVAAKNVVLDYIQRRKTDRIGAVVFARDAYTLCPLTLDYTILSQMISGLELGVIDEKGTAIGNAVGISINRLRRSDATTRVIILVTDGASNEGNITPEQAAEFANTVGIRIYPVLIGRNADRSAINPDLLIQMAEATGGRFFKAEDTRALKMSFHEILDALEKSRIEDKGVTYAEVFRWYLWPALLLAFFDILAGIFVFRRIP